MGLPRFHTPATAVVVRKSQLIEARWPDAPLILTLLGDKAFVRVGSLSEREPHRIRSEGASEAFYSMQFRPVHTEYTRVFGIPEMLGNVTVNEFALENLAARGHLLHGDSAFVFHHFPRRAAIGETNDGDTKETFLIVQKPIEVFIFNLGICENGNRVGFAVPFQATAQCLKRGEATGYIHDVFHLRH